MDKCGFVLQAMKSCNPNGWGSALTLITLIALFLSACHVPVDEVVGRYRLVREKPDRIALIGTWVIDQATFEDMRTRGRYDVSQPTEVILRDDDSFEMTNLPDWYQDGFGESHGGLVNLAGNWSLDEFNGFWGVKLVAPARSAPYLDLREPRYTGQPRYLFEIVIGDPDSGEAMRFVKK